MDTPLFDGELVHARRMIYTPSAFAKSNLVHLQEVGQLQARSPHASTRQGLASYLFFVVESGSGTLEYEGETRVLSAGDCVFLDCRHPYRHYTGDDLWQLRWAHFYGPNMAAIYKKYRERGGQPSFHPENTAPYTRRLEALYTLAASDNSAGGHAHRLLMDGEIVIGGLNTVPEHPTGSAVGPHLTAQYNDCDRLCAIGMVGRPDAHQGQDSPQRQQPGHQHHAHRAPQPPG